MALIHLQRHGHTAIALVGGGTALIGDPSGKTEMRQILTREKIELNATCMRRQFARYLRFEDKNAMMIIMRIG
jgi:tyrosyl-tRNA synthetase